MLSQWQRRLAFTQATRTGNTPGGLAQLGERLAGSQKVSGSSPLSSTSSNAAPREGKTLQPQSNLLGPLQRVRK
jgi:hypothetical protein